MRHLLFACCVRAALSGVSGTHGLQAAHYWLARLLGALAARTLPYTSLAYVEGRVPQDPARMAHVVPVLPSYVKVPHSAGTSWRMGAGLRWMWMVSLHARCSQDAHAWCAPRKVCCHLRH